MSAPAKIPLSSLPRGELEALAERLLAENDALKQAVAELKAEVATLEGVKGRPEVKPSGMEKGAGSEPGATNRGRGGRGKADRLTVHEERVEGGRPRRFALQGLRGLPGPGPGAAPARGPPASGALADPGRPGGGRPDAGR